MEEDVLNVSHIWAFQYEARHVIRISQTDSEWALRSMQEVNGTVSASCGNILVAMTTPFLTF